MGMEGFCSSWGSVIYILVIWGFAILFISPTCFQPSAIHFPHTVYQASRWNFSCTLERETLDVFKKRERKKEVLSLKSIWKSKQSGSLVPKPCVSFAIWAKWMEKCWERRRAVKTRAKELDTPITSSIALSHSCPSLFIFRSKDLSLTARELFLSVSECHLHASQLIWGGCLNTDFSALTQTCWIQFSGGWAWESTFQHQPKVIHVHTEVLQFDCIMFTEKRKWSEKL